VLVIIGSVLEVILIESKNGHIFRGVVTGKTIQLEQDAGLPSGQAVAVTLVPVRTGGEGLKRSFGSWAGGAEELDEFLDRVRQGRKHSRGEQSR